MKISEKLRVPTKEQNTQKKRRTTVFFSKDFFLFVLCGGVGTLTNFLCSLGFSFFFRPVFSYIAGYALSLYITYFLNCRIIFQEKQNSKGYFKFVVSYLPNFTILLSFVYLFIDILHRNPIIVYALAGILGLPLTYVVVTLFAFGRKL